MPGSSGIVLTFLAALIVAFFGAGLTVVPVVLYVVARWRHAHQSDVPDPQLGLKAAWSFFKLAGFQAAVFGVFLLVYGALGDTLRGAALRTGVSFLLPGALVFGLHAFAMRRSNHREFPHTMRMFSGLNMTLIGVVAIVASIAALAVTLHENTPGDLIALAWSLCTTYVLAWIVSLRGFLKVHVPSWKSSSQQGRDGA